MNKKLLFLVILNSFFIFDGVSQEIAKDFRLLVNGEPSLGSLEINHSNELLIAGNFHLVKGQEARGLATVSLEGEILSVFTNLEIDGAILKAHYIGESIFIVGNFSQVNGVSREGYAMITKEGELVEGFTDLPNMKIRGIAGQSDGKIIMVGEFIDLMDQGYYRMVRLMPDGSVDDTFTNNITFNQVANNVKIDVEGNILVLGDVLMKFDPNGQFLSNWNFRGLSLPSFLFDFEVTSENKIYLAGAFTSYDGKSFPSLIRLLENGALDEDFNPQFDSNARVEIYSAKTLKNGKVIALGIIENIASFITVYLLGTDGKVERSISRGQVFGAEKIGIDQEDNIYFSGQFPSLNNVVVDNFAKYSSSNNFNIDRSFKLPVFNLDLKQNTPLLIAEDQSILLAKTRPYINLDLGSISKFNKNGVSIPSYISAPINAIIRGMDRDVEGKIYALGTYFDQEGGLKYYTKLNPDGTLDQDYEPNNTASKFNGPVEKIVAKGDKVYFGGHFNLFGDQIVNGLVALDKDGNQVWQSQLPENSQVFQLKVSNDNSVYVQGYFPINGIEYRFLKINSDGSISPNFRLQNVFLNDFAIDVEGSLLIVGGRGAFEGIGISTQIIKYKSDGSRDLTFPSISTSNTGSIFAIEILDNGMIALGGDFTAINEDYTQRKFALLNQDYGLRESYSLHDVGYINGLYQYNGILYLIGYVQDADYSTSIAKVVFPIENQFTGFEIELSDQNRIELNWEVDSKYADRVLIYRKSEQEDDFVKIGEVGSDVGVFQDIVTKELSTYRYFVQLSNGSFSSQTSDTLAVTTPFLEPIALEPSNILQTSFQANWEEVTNGLGYQLEVMIGHFDDFSADMVYDIGSGSSFEVKDLSPITAYSYRIRRVLSSGFSAYSNVIQLATLIPVPNAPQSFKIEWDSSGYGVDLSWEDKSDDEEGFLIKRAKVIAEDFEVIADLGVNSQAYSDMPIFDEGTYFYQLMAYNSGGTSEILEASFKAILIPQFINLDEFTTNTLKVSWANFQFTEGYNLEVYEESTIQSALKFTFTDVKQTEFLIEGLTSNTKYFIRVQRASYVGLSDFSVFFEFTTLIDAPVSPVNFVAQNEIAGIRLNWEDVSEIEEGFVVERSSGADFVEIARLGENATTLLDTNVEDAVAYQYRIYAFNAGGSSEPVLAEIQFVLSAETGRQIHIFPNPTANRLQIEIDGKSIEGGLMLFDSRGLLVKKWERIPEGGLDISDLPRGLYLVRIEGTDQNARIIKQ